MGYLFAAGLIESAADIAELRMRGLRVEVTLRHGIDKAAGGLLLAGGDRSQACLMSTGRITPMVSRSAPTDAAVDLLRRSGVTVVAFVREDRINVYTHPCRITAD